uniref:Uncharacterized protein n=1 Tax=Arundo donax TaxID=35708 RepID=A0A0A9ARR4_ARUDO
MFSNLAGQLLLYISTYTRSGCLSYLGLVHLLTH